MDHPKVQVQRLILFFPTICHQQVCLKTRAQIPATQRAGLIGKFIKTVDKTESCMYFPWSITPAKASITLNDSIAILLIAIPKFNDTPN